MSDAARERARAELRRVHTRGEIKRLGAAIDADPALRDALIAEARAAGRDLPDDAAAWPGKKLVRAALDRAADAQVLGTPIARDEPFTCAHCGSDVTAHGRTARDHCPYCLRSLHVDVVPGDRAADCGGVMDPIGATVRGDTVVLRYRCRRCGAERNQRAVTDGAPPDDAAALRRVAAGEAP